MSREKSYIMTQLDGNNHSVFSLNYHLILITKYRKEVITDVISEYLKHIFCYIAPKYKITLTREEALLRNDGEAMEWTVLGQKLLSHNSRGRAA